MPTEKTVGIYAAHCSGSGTLYALGSPLRSNDGRIRSRHSPRLLRQVIARSFLGSSNAPYIIVVRNVRGLRYAPAMPRLPYAPFHAPTLIFPERIIPITATHRAPSSALRYGHCTLMMPRDEDHRNTRVHRISPAMI